MCGYAINLSAYKLWIPYIVQKRAERCRYQSFASHLDTAQSERGKGTNGSESINYDLFLFRLIKNGEPGSSSDVRKGEKTRVYREPLRIYIITYFFAFVERSFKNFTFITNILLLHGGKGTYLSPCANYLLRILYLYPTAPEHFKRAAT